MSALEKVMSMLGVDRVDEGKQAEIKDYLQTLVETKAVELSQPKIDEAIKIEKERLTESYEIKFEEYKKDITEKFSNFVDSVLDEEMQIPAKVLKYAQLGEQYHDLIEQFKLRLAINEGVLKEEVKNILKEAKGEILSLKDELNESIKKTMDLEKDAKEMASHIYLLKKCEGLTESQKKTVVTLMEGVNTKEGIDTKFDIIVESIRSDIKLNEEEEKMKKKVCSECGNEVSINEGDTDVTKCPKCGGEMKSEANEGKGSAEVATEPAKEPIVESLSPVAQQWVKILKENKF